MPRPLQERTELKLKMESDCQTRLKDQTEGKTEGKTKGCKNDTGLVQQHERIPKTSTINDQCSGAMSRNPCDIVRFLVACNAQRAESSYAGEK